MIRSVLRQFLKLIEDIGTSIALVLKMKVRAKNILFSHPLITRFNAVQICLLTDESRRAKTPDLKNRYLYLFL